MILTLLLAATFSLGMAVQIVHPSDAPAGAFFGFFFVFLLIAMLLNKGKRHGSH